MYYKEIKMLIEKIIKENIEKKELLEYLIDNFDCEAIYNSDDNLTTDVFFTLKHYASEEENVREEEWLYFLQCLEGQRKYNMKEKMAITI